MQHVALVRKACLEAILEGRKRVESRLTVSRRPPFGRVAPGDVVFFKEVGGPFRACAMVERVEFHVVEGPDMLRELAERFEPVVLGGASYWRERASARYASFVYLSGVRSIDAGPDYRRWRSFHPRSGWILGPEPLVRLPARPGG